MPAPAGKIRLLLHIGDHCHLRHNVNAHAYRTSLSQKRCVLAACISRHCAEKDPFAQPPAHSQIKDRPLRCGHARRADLQDAHPQSQTRLLGYAQAID